MANATLIKSFKAEAAVNKCRIVKMGAADGQVVQGAAATDALIGVSTDIDAAINERCDVIMSGEADIEFGGTVTRGALLTSDASGRAVAAAPSAGNNNRTIGVALVSAVVGDIGRMQISQGSVQG